jgi:outer membrane protein
MNKLSLAINVVLVVAVATLFGIFFSNKNTEVAPVLEGEKLEKLPIAYLNTDSLLSYYVFAQNANEKLMKKQEDARLKLNTKARTLQSEMADFQHKLENNAFLSRERAEKEQQRLLKKQQELQELEAKLTEDILVENQKLNMQLTDSLDKFLKEYNADGRYHLILSNTAKDNVLYGVPGYDITNEVINGLNARCKK